MDFILDFMKKINFEEDAITYFSSLYSSLSNEDWKEIKEIEAIYFSSNDENIWVIKNEVFEKLTEFANQREINCYSMYMLFLLICSEKLLGEYRKNNIPDVMFYELMCDLNYKLIECKKLHNIWGTFTFSWFSYHINLKIFSLGRFQYEITKFWKDEYTYKNFTLKKDDKVYSIHIPSSGKLDKETRLISYKKAYEFFGYKDKEIMPIVCNTWLLFPDMDKIYDKDSNLMAFYNDFDIMSNVIFDNAFPDAWRVFYKHFEGDADALPGDTSLQRNIKDWLKKGNKIGTGLGVILFDGEKIINKK